MRVYLWARHHKGCDFMTASEPGGDQTPRGTNAGVDTGGGPGALSARPAARPAGGRPILWKWWLAAALISLALWAGILQLVA